MASLSPAGRRPVTNLADLLALRAATTPARTALRVAGEAVSYRELSDRVAALAAGLAALGVRPGDPVCVLFDTSIDYVASWLALTRLGAVEVPVNTGFRGEALAHALRLTGARALLVDPAYLPLVIDVLAGAPRIRRVVVRGDPPPAGRLPGVQVSGFGELSGGPYPPSPPMASAPGDPALLLFTSGSTGPSKACTIPHRYVLRHAEIFCEQLRIRADDVLYAPFPLFHVDATVFTVAAAFTVGGTAALAPRFSVSRFWDDCRRHGVTVFDYMGATLSLLAKQPPSPRDADNPVRLGWGVPGPPRAAEFERRFDLELVEVYGLSDAGIVCYNRPGEPRREGSCGRPVPPFEARVHDRHGCEVPVGEVGELVIRAGEPYLLTTGYYGDPAATAEAFRDQWFHTGDQVRRDADGYVYFVGRTRDVVRRRGENISAFDLEQVLLAHPDILEVAAYGVPSELTEEDVMVTVVPRAGAPLAPHQVWEWAAARLARHMIPRYVRIAASVPRTGTEKIAKYRLRALGVTPDTADREG
jgi:carnitine-CoA ligase